MPIRSRSHQLEDLSISRFKDLLPDSWVVRTKSHDYGIDLEVEIFDLQGQSTGLVFLVQLRATDDPKRADRVRLDVDQIQYFRSLQLPILVIRYLREPEKWYYEWAGNIGNKIKPGALSFTHRYTASDEWSIETTERITRTLQTLRTFECVSENSKIGLRINKDGLNNAQWFSLEAALDDFTAIFRDFYITESAEDLLSADIGFEGESLYVKLDCISSATFHGISNDRTRIRDCIAYGLILILQRYKISKLAASVATQVVKHNIEPKSRALALKASISLAPDIRSMVSMAVMGKIHEEHDEIYVDFVARLFRTIAPDEDRRHAIEQFYDVATKHAGRISPTREGAVRYSLANHLRNDGRNREALTEYVRAKRLRPSYSKTEYFLHEVGVCFFNLHRYNCARVAYSRSIEAGLSDQRAFIHLGDATFFAGKVIEASKIFDQISNGSDDILNYEARLKANTCRWLSELARSETLTRENKKDHITDSIDGDELFRFLINVDGLDNFSHYNLGILKAERKMWLEALGHFLTASFVCDQDLEAWVSAIICACNIGEPDLIIGIMATSIAHAGRAPYDKVRDKFFAQAAPTEMMDGLDRIFRELHKSVRESRRNDMTIRVLNEAHYDVIIINERSH